MGRRVADVVGCTYPPGVCTFRDPHAVIAVFALAQSRWVQGLSWGIAVHQGCNAISCEEASEASAGTERLLLLFSTRVLVEGASMLLLTSFWCLCGP